MRSVMAVASCTQSSASVALVVVRHPPLALKSVLNSWRGTYEWSLPTRRLRFLL